MLITNFVQMKQENELLRDIGYGQDLSDFYDEYKDLGGFDFPSTPISMSTLEAKKKDALKRVDFVRKEHKQKKRMLRELEIENQALESEISKLKEKIPRSKEETKFRALEGREL